MRHAGRQLRHPHRLQSRRRAISLMIPLRAVPHPALMTRSSTRRTVTRSPRMPVTTATPHLSPLRSSSHNPPLPPPPHRKLAQEGSSTLTPSSSSSSSAGVRFKRSPPTPGVTSPPASTPPPAPLPPAPPVDEVEKCRTTLESLVKDFQRDATHLCFRQQDVRRRLAKVAQDRSELQKEQVRKAIEAWCPCSLHLPGVDGCSDLCCPA